MNDRNSDLLVESQAKEPPRWILMVGAGLLGLGVVFLMVLILLAVFDRPVPCDSRWLVGLLLSLLLAVGSGFLGNVASVKSNAAVISDYPLVFGMSGGGAVFVIVLLVFMQLVPGCSSVGLSLLSVDVRSDTQSQLLRVVFSPFAVPLDQQVVVTVGDNERFENPWTSAPLDNPTSGLALVSIQRTEPRGCVRLLVRDAAMSRVQESNTICFTEEAADDPKSD